MLNQRNYLLDKPKLMEKLHSLKLQLDEEFKEIDGAHLPVEYTDLLKKNHNPGIERPMEKRIFK